MDAVAVPSKPSAPPPAPPGPLERAISRVWPGPDVPASKRVVSVVLAVIVVAAIVLVPSRPGLGWPLVGLAFAGCALALVRPLGAATVGWCVASVMLLSVGAVRASGSLFSWCVVGAFACGSLAVAGGRTVRAVSVGAVLVTPAGLRGLGWWCKGAAAAMRRRSGNRLGWTLAAMAVLVLVFGALFASADPVFAGILDRVTSGFDTPDGWRPVFVTLGVAPLAIGTAYLASARPKLDQIKPLKTGLVRRLEWALPLAVLDLLFLGFVLVQLKVLFGGDKRVQITPDLTYAEYARSGFWQLLTVAALTLGVIGAATQIASKQTIADRVTLRALLGLLAMLTLIIVTSALHRMAIYDDAYGYTRLRLAVSVIELWLGAVFVLVLVAGVRMRAAWLARTAIALAVVALLAVSYLNPDGFIASRNVDRYQHSGRIDIGYLSSLSADAGPALSRLPEPLRTRVLIEMRTGQLDTPDDWRSWNLGRQRARSLAD